MEMTQNNSADAVDIAHSNSHAGVAAAPYVARPWPQERSSSQSAGHMPVDQMFRFMSFYSNATSTFFLDLNLPESLIGPHDQLAYIKNRGCFRVSQLAQIIGVSRPSIYSWSKGESTIQEENADKVNRLYQALSKLSDESSGQLSRLFGHRLSNDQTVGDALSGIAAGRLDGVALEKMLDPYVVFWQESREKTERLDKNKEALLSGMKISETVRTVSG